MIVLSDGRPLHGEMNMRMLEKHLKRTISRIESAKIEVLGIGIKTDAVKNFYSDYVIVEDLDSLMKISYGKLSRILKKNGSAV